MEKKRVLSALSGGVDSAAAAAFLQREGYEVDGAFLRLHQENDAQAQAEAVAKSLGLGFFPVEAQELFRRRVEDPFVAEYCAGRTPNPCILCNQYLKFGLLLDFALERGYDYLATGHYARIAQDEATGHYRLLRGADGGKDQSYVLYRLTQHQLSHLLFPVGTYGKETIRAAAAELQLTNAHSPDSQDICFIPDGDYAAYLLRRGAVTEPGDFIDTTGQILGRHRGLACYTIGQSKRLGIALGRRVYVLDKDPAANTVTLGEDAQLYRREVAAHSVSFIAGHAPDREFRCTAKSRYSQKECGATVTVLPNDELRLLFDEPQRAITPGQALVLYRGEEVLGGGIIQ